MKRKMSPKGRLNLIFVLIVAGILFVAIAMIVLLEYFIIQTSIFNSEKLMDSGLFWIIIFGVISIIIGCGLAVLFSKVFLKPINTLMEGMSKLSSGDFSTRLNFNEKSGLKVVSDGFNSLATELQNTEILRSDFVNNFSHELKTPIVSVKGLIGLLKNEKLTKEKREKYIEIIEEEVNRLTEMTTNMLNLSKIEKQNIVTEKKQFNVSEQIRTCVLLLQNKWEKKGLTFSLDFEEFSIFANKDLLKEVWLNLIDNAIKFSTKNHEIIIGISANQNNLTVAVTNSGKIIDKGQIDKIFNKFYKAEDTTDGNGIGLSIVKHIVDLHNGSVQVKSEDNETTFSILLPIN